MKSENDTSYYTKFRTSNLRVTWSNIWAIICMHSLGEEVVHSLMQTSNTLDDSPVRFSQLQLLPKGPFSQI